MGTRSLVIAIKNKEVKLAQYGQFDGYPEGQGVGLLEALQSKLNEFSVALENLHFLTKEEVNALYRNSKTNDLNALEGGYKVIPYIMDGTVTGVVDSYKFAAESLWCEWCYVIDFDANTFEVYKGFNKRKLAQNERFYALEEYRDTSTPFHPVKFLCKFELSNLPGEQEFIEVCKEAYNSTKNNINKEV